jgi:hypothetical protein
VHSLNHRLLVLLQRISTYLPLVGTVLILLIATFDSNLFNFVPLSLLLAIMTISFVFTVVYLETQLRESSEAVQKLSDRIHSLEKTQQEYLQSTRPLIQTVTLAQGFEIVISKIRQADHLRIFAISSQQILGFIRFHAVDINRCSLLVREFAKDDRDNRDFRKQIELVVRDWRALERDGRIKNLTVRSYDFFPTEYECIFDDKCMLLGLYDSDPEDYSGVRVRNAVLIENSAQPGRQMIAEYIERFDQLFQVCHQRHGSDSYE